MPYLMMVFMRRLLPGRRHISRLQSVQCFIAGSIQISVICIFQFNHDANAVFWYFDQNITVTDSDSALDFMIQFSLKGSRVQKNSMIKVFLFSVVALSRTLIIFQR